MTKVVCYNMATGHTEVERVLDYAAHDLSTQLQELFDAMVLRDMVAGLDTETDHTYYVV